MNRCCKKCDIIKNINDFPRYSFTCKSCKKEYNKIYRQNNKEDIKNYNLTYRTKNKDKLKKLSKDWRNRNTEHLKEYRKENIDKQRLYQKSDKYKEWKLEYYKKNYDDLRNRSKEWRKKNPGYTYKYLKNRIKTDINFKLAHYVRKRTNAAIKGKGLRKRESNLKLLGCSSLELKKYLESKFLPTMTWENYGKYWHIDHIIPCSKFDLTKEEQQKKCFHYTNLQPLFAVTQVINGIEYIGNLNKQDKL